MAVYFIRDAVSGLVKIGHAGNPWHRLSKMQSDSPGQLTIAALIDGGAGEEAEMHSRFADLRVRGEWFREEAALWAFLASQTQPERLSTRGSKTAPFWNGVSAQEVSRRTGLPSRALCEISKGKYRPSPENAIKIQRACGVSAIKLIFGDLADEAA